MPLRKHVLLLPAVMALAASADVTAEPGDAAGGETGSSQGAPLFDCIPEHERARVAYIEQLRADPEAFLPGAARLPPLFLTNRERTFTWAGLVYLRTSDHDAGTRTQLLAPLLFSHCAPDSRTFITPLYGHRIDREGTARLVLNYFRRRDRLADADLVFPFFWSTRERDEPNGSIVRRSGALAPFAFWGRDARTGEHHTFFPPLYWRWGDNEHDTWIAGLAFRRTTPRGFSQGFAPLYFAGRDDLSGEHHTFLPPLYWRWGDREVTRTLAGNVFVSQWRDRRHLAVVPFFFSGEGEKRWYTVVPPLLWRWGARDDSSLTTIAGPFFGHRSGSDWHAGLLPLWLGGEKNGHRYDVLPPLLTYRRELPDGGTALWAVNTYLRTREDGFTLASVPVFFAGRTGARHHTLIPPLLAYHGGDGETETTWILNTGYQKRPGGFTLGVAPLLLVHREGERATTIAGNVYVKKTPAQSHLGVVPFYFRGRGPSFSYDAVPPLFLQHEGPASRTLWAAPYYRHEDTVAQRRWEGVLPLWLSSEDARAGTRTDILPPLLAFRRREPHRTITFAAQTYFERRADGFTFTSFPFVFSGREGDRHHTLIPPLLTWHAGNGQMEETLVANTYLRTTPDGHTFRFFPLVWSGRDGDAHHLHLPPLFWRWGDATETVTIAGTAFLRRTQSGSDFGLAPLYFGGRHEGRFYDVLLPLYARWGNAEHTRTALFLPGYHFRTREGWHAGMLPFWFGGRDRQGRYDLVPPLLFYRGENEAAGRTRTVALQTYVETRPHGHTALSFPFFYSRREGDERALLIPPLLTWHKRNAAEFTWATAPFLFLHRSAHKHHTLVPPLFWRWGNDEETTTLAGNVLWRSTEDSRHLAVLPLLFHGQTPNSRYTVIPPLLAARWTEERTTTTWVANTVHQQREDGYTLTSFPLLHVHRSPERQRTFIPPLYWRWGDGRASTTLAGNVYLRTAPDERELTVFPLLLHSKKGAAHQTTLPPLLFHHAGDGVTERTWMLNAFHQKDPHGWRFNLVPFVFAARGPTHHHTFVPPLYWRWGDVLSTTTVVGPAYAKQKLDERRYGLFPFFDVKTTPSERRVLSPLFFHSRTPEHERTVVAGLYWRFAGPETKTRVVFPFWWDVHSPEKGTRLTTAFPLYWRYQRPEETTHLLLNAMWSRGQTEHGPSWAFHLFPLVDATSDHPEHLRWQLLTGVVGRERRYDRHRWKVGWVWLAPRQKLEPEVGTGT